MSIRWVKRERTLLYNAFGGKMYPRLYTMDMYSKLTISWCPDSMAEWSSPFASDVW